MPDDKDLPIEPEPKKIYDEDEALSETAKGHFTSEEALELDESQIDTMGRAAGVTEAESIDDTALAIEKRDRDRA